LVPVAAGKAVIASITNASQEMPRWVDAVEKGLVIIG
jgi:hypothetical protein